MLPIRINKTNKLLLKINRTNETNRIVQNAINRIEIFFVCKKFSI